MGKRELPGERRMDWLHWPQLTQTEQDTLLRAYRPIVDGDDYVTWARVGTTSEMRAAEPVWGKLLALQAERTSPTPAQFWIWDAHRETEPPYLPPGLGLSYPQIAGDDPRVPDRVRQHLRSRAKDDHQDIESRITMAKRAYEAVERYRRRCEESVERRATFRRFWHIMTHTEPPAEVK